MTVSKISFAAILLLMVTGTSFSQLTLDGEFRSRGMVNHGIKYPFLENTDPVLSFDQRSRIILNYATEKYETRFSLQDTRIWGSDDMMNKTGTEGNSYALGIYEAWVDLKLSEKSALKIGRQEWNYNDMRILSYRNWWTSGLSYDGLLYHRSDDENGLDIDLGVSYNNNGNRIGGVDNSDWETYKIKSLDFLNISKTLGEKASVSLMFTLSTKVDTSNNAQLGTGTHGLNFNYNTQQKISNGIFASASGYYQHGTDLNRGTDGKYKSISAYLITAEIGLRTLEKRLETSVGMELISGRDYTKTDDDYNNTRHTFDLLYSGRFPFYGGDLTHFLIQDSYLVGTKGGGYFDPYIEIKYKLNKKNILNAKAFFPQLTTKVRAHTGINALTNKPMGAEVDDNGNPVYWEGNLGSYFDFSYTHKFNKEIIVKSGFSYGVISDTKNQMVYGYKDTTTKELYNLGNTYFGWVMLVIKPKFFQ